MQNKFLQGFLFEMSKAGASSAVVTTSQLTWLPPLRAQARLADKVSKRTIPIKGTKSYVSPV